MNNRVVRAVNTGFLVSYGRNELGYQFASPLSRNDIAFLGDFTGSFRLQFGNDKSGFGVGITNCDTFSPETS